MANFLSKKLPDYEIIVCDIYFYLEGSSALQWKVITIPHKALLLVADLPIFNQKPENSYDH